MTPVRGDFHVRGLRLAYHTWGEPSSPAVLALHGFMDHGLAFAPTMRSVKSDLFVVAPDLRGHGASEWVGDGGYYHFYDYFDDVARLLHHLAIDRFSIVGHSMGGSVATATAALHAKRVDRVLLLEGMGPPFSDLDDTVDRLRSWLGALGFEKTSGDREARGRRRTVMKDLDEATDRLCRVNPRLPRERASELATSFTQSAFDGTGLVWCQDPLHRTPAAKPFLEAEAMAFWQALSMPVLSLYGEHGWPPERLEDRHAAVLDLTSRVVEGAGHNLHHDRPELIAQILDSFVAGGRIDDWPGVTAST